MKVQCAHTEMVDIDLLVMNPLNPNKHGEKQIELLAKIMNHQGWRHPVTISKRSGFVVVGHGRIMAARKLGWTQVPVDRQDFATEADEYAHLIADNKISELAEHDDAMMFESLKAFPDMDLDLLGIPDLVIPEVEMLPQGDPDAVPELPEEPKTKLGDIYQLGRHKLMCADSTSFDNVHQILPDEVQVDIVYTDPPYGIDEETDRAFAARSRKAKGNTFTKIIGDDSIDTALAAFGIADVKSNTVCYWGGNYYAHKLDPTACWVVWDKRVEENQRDMNSDCELAYVKHPTKKSVRIFRHLWKGMIKGSEHGEGRVHPTQKPVALAEWCFEELAPTSKTVLDLFGGSGSTLIACEKTNRQCFMMELDPRYCDVIVKRWEDLTGKKAELVQS